MWSCSSDAWLVDTVPHIPLSAVTDARRLGERHTPCHHVCMAQPPRPADARFLTPADVAEVLAVTPSQVLKYLRDRELRGMKLPGKGEWRIEATELERFIEARYRATDTAHDTRG